MMLNVSSIQHFTTGDGPGIRTTVFLKGCNLHCPWCHNPETISAEPVILHYPTGDVTNGQLMDISDIVNEIMEDVDFYGDDGGVTVSGGDPMLQYEGVYELISALKERGIPSIIDTAASVPYNRFQSLGDLPDTYFIDLKAANSEDYKSIGGSFDTVCTNIRKLISDGRNVRIRIPLIPGFNDSAEYSERMCEVLQSLGAYNVDLLPFHRLGSGKYKALGMEYAYKDTEPMTVARAKEIAITYSKYFNVNVEK